MSANAATVWFVIGLALILLEFAVPGVILVFFGLGAWVVTLTTYIGLTSSLESQLLVFSVSSILLLVFLRKWIKGKFHGHVRDVQDLSKNLDEFVGSTVVVLREILPGKQGGAVEFKGAFWGAVSDDHMNAGDEATITGVKGITLRVRKK